MSVAPDRNLALELVRVTEAAALGSARWIGRGDKEAADQAAVDGMHAVLHTIHMDGIVVIGEGEKDEAPMLHNGEAIGDGTPPEVDIAVDPLEGTRLCALGMPNAIAVIALAERGTMFDPGPIVYMEKLAVGDRFADLLDLDRPLGETVERIAERKGTEVNDVMAVVLNRPRHEEGIDAIRKAGGRVQLITDGDVAGVLNAVSPDRKADFLWGIGGTPEGVISASAVKCIGGALVGRLHPRDDAERTGGGRRRLRRRPRPTHDDLVRGRGRVLLRHRRDRRRRAPGRPLRGARGATTESLVMRSRSGTVRRIAVEPRPHEAARADRLRRRLSAARARTISATPPATIARRARRPRPTACRRR